MGKNKGTLPNCLDKPIDDLRHEWQLAFIDLETGESERMMCLKCNKVVLNRKRNVPIKAYYFNAEDIE